ncbi:MAG: hypothetical protein ACKVS8_04325 [Phycisphaerales bacterium]
MKTLTRTLRDHPTVSTLVDTGAAFLSRVRFKALLWMIGIGLCTWAAILLAGLAWVPVVGVAMAAAAATINKVAHRLDKPVCHGCGHDMTGQPLGPAGAVCPTCGSLHQPRPTGEAPLVAAVSEEDEAKAAA